jgi:decaprenyl-phosphate phosphoribosyltransferase
MNQGKRHTLFAWLKLLRPGQYTKNLFVFVPLFFAAELTDTTLLWPATLAFVAFCLAASAIYIFNDFIDRREDRLHPQKRLRPLAAGTVSPPAALLLATLLGATALVLISSLGATATTLLAIYLAMNLAYSLALKNAAIVDISVIATGFVLRLMTGAAVTGVELSAWIIVMTFLLALHLALAKRRCDLLIEVPAGQPRPRVIQGYNTTFLDAALAMTAAAVVLTYILWSLSPQVITYMGSQHLHLTSVFVVMGLLRYMQIAMVENAAGDPSRVLLRDRFLQLVLAGWLGSLIWLLYLD